MEFPGVFSHLQGRDCRDSLGCPTLQHAPVGRVSDGVDVWWHLVPLLALVHVNDLLRVDGQLLVGVDHNAEETRVSLQGNSNKSWA